MLNAPPYSAAVILMNVLVSITLTIQLSSTTAPTLFVAVLLLKMLWPMKLMVLFTAWIAAPLKLFASLTDSHKTD